MAIFGSPVKLYMLLFLFALVLWVVYYVSFTMTKKSEHFADLIESEPEVHKESITQELDSSHVTGEDALNSECNLYNLRQEVINIFELYMSRKPSIDEIQKYSVKGNEQDILLAIIKDFNIPASESEKNKPKLNDMRKDACKEIPTKPVKVEKAETKSPVVSTNTNKITEESKIDEPYTNNEASKSAKTVCIPYEKYQELKQKLLELQSDIQIM
jgi:hypothetical protein